MRISTESLLVGQIVFAHNGATRMTMTKQYDFLNRLTEDVPGTNDILGAALMTNAGTVNGQAAWRKNEFFWRTVGTNNSSSPAWLGDAAYAG